MILNRLGLIADNARWPVVGSTDRSIKIAYVWNAASVLELGPFDFRFYFLAPVLRLLLSPTR